MKSARTPTQADFHEAISNRSDRWFAACLRITRSHELAEDAVQDALLSAWNKRHQFGHSARLETWIHRIAVNAALQLLRKNRPGIFEPLDIEIPDDDITPEGARSIEELGNDFSAAAARLSARTDAAYSRRTIAVLALILDVDQQWFLQQFEKPITNMTLLHYPPQDASTSGFGIHPHEDTDALTILVPDSVGGLMVKSRNHQQWLEVDAAQDALVVNIGDLL